MSCRVGGEHDWRKRVVEVVLSNAWIEGLLEKPYGRLAYSYCPRCGKVLL